jgi:hypothetical protein
MRRGIQFSILALAAMFLTACEPTEWEAEASCEGGSSSWKCSGKGKIKGTFHTQQVYGLYSASSSNLDAADFSIDLDGSTVVTPASGNVTISLVDSHANLVQAAKTFAWVKSGTRLYLVNPSEVNTWAQANAGSADTVRYQLQPFDVSGVNPGDNIFSVTSEYAGVPKAVSVTTFSTSDGGCGIGYCQEQ